jgi:hypothetical protein
MCRSSKVGVAMSKILRVCSRGGVPQAYPALKKGDYSGCESKEQWSNLQRSHQQRQQVRRYGDQKKLFQEFMASSCPIKQLSPIKAKIWTMYLIIIFLPIINIIDVFGTQALP